MQVLVLLEQFVKLVIIVHHSKYNQMRKYHNRFHCSLMMRRTNLNYNLVQDQLPFVLLEIIVQLEVQDIINVLQVHIVLKELLVLLVIIALLQDLL